MYRGSSSSSNSKRTLEEVRAHNASLQYRWKTRLAIVNASSSDEDDVEASNAESDSREQDRLRKLANTSSSWQRRRDSYVASVEVIRSLTTYIPRNGGSVMGRRYTRRLRQEAHDKIIQEYFNPDCIHSDDTFRRRFRMRRPKFLRILNAVAEEDVYFRDKTTITGRLSLSGLQKVVCVFLQLSQGISGDSTDIVCSIGGSTALQALYKFCVVVIRLFEKEYLRCPTEEDVTRIMAERGFPGMLGSLDCMHWVWKNCPTSYAGQYTNYRAKPTVILEVVADKSLWIWHAFFGMVGSNNDITVLNKSNLFIPCIRGEAARHAYTVNDREYSLGYYLVDGIYPEWGALIAAEKKPHGLAKKCFTHRHESVRKDVERAFGVLQSRWHLITTGARTHSIVKMGRIMKTCIILHNMIVEDEKEEVTRWQPQVGEEIPARLVNRTYQSKMTMWLSNRGAVRSQARNHELKKDLIQHVYKYYSDKNITIPEPTHQVYAEHLLAVYDGQPLVQVEYEDEDVHGVDGDDVGASEDDVDEDDVTDDESNVDEDD